MRPAFPAWAAATVLLVGHLTASGNTGAGEALQIRIVNFNFESVRVMWNASEGVGTNLTFLYSFTSMKTNKHCSSYILQEGRTAGCLLDAPGDEILSFSIWNGTHPVLNNSVWISNFLKPSLPKELHFQWRQEALTVTCPELPYSELLYEVQHRSLFDSEWQAKEENTCNVTIESLDIDKCYFVRARVKTMESGYGSDTYPSDWSEVAHLQGAELRDSCQEKTLFPKFVLMSGLVVFLIMFLVFLLVWKLRRVKKLLMPSVPDPKFTFPGLFEAHRGNFQEWIKDTQNVTQLDKVEEREQECILEEAPMVQHSKAEMETPTETMIGPLCLQTGDKEAAGDPGQPPCQRPQGEEVLSLGSFTFVISDNSYVTL
ncbi:cytokine receptor-like factor 2 [Rhinolophus ferrumequinum]|uniref:Cytokine receptor-like factor 2 n=1 Tax=Rhinolophus ferrumequinum TaxID=59479 RepID=A0A671E042_RHIFE|nr:cytokine receptor-like factor 2 [Rhinolophus ferrumequinum]